MTDWIWWFHFSVTFSGCSYFLYTSLSNSVQLSCIPFIFVLIINGGVILTCVLPEQKCVLFCFIILQNLSPYMTYHWRVTQSIICCWDVSVIHSWNWWPDYGTKVVIENSWGVIWDICWTFKNCICTLHWKCCNGARYLRGLQGNDDDNILPNMNCFFRFWSAWHVFVFLSICFSIYLTFLLILTQLLCVSNEITQIVYCPSNCLIRLQPYTLSSLNIPQLFESLCVFLYFVPH